MTTVEIFAHILDLKGTFAFAISGALAAANRRLDLFGIPGLVVRCRQRRRHHT